jgi:hypothetical protein
VNISYRYISYNRWYNFQPPKGIVLHGTAGPFKASLDELTKNVSANYLIDTDGTIYCLVNPYEGWRAWANGIWEAPDLSVAWLKSIWDMPGDDDGHQNPNRWTISIEHVALSPNMVAHNYASMPTVQREASQQLCAQLVRDFNLPRMVELWPMIGHYQIERYDRANCPGVINVPKWNQEVLVRLTMGDRWIDPVTNVEVNNVWGFLDFFNKNGGIKIFGRPKTGAYGDIITDAQGAHPKVVQYFERARFERRTDAAYNVIQDNGIGVELGNVGTENLNYKQSAKPAA